MNVYCVLLAAGAGSRFGSNKLLYEIDGVSMLERALRLHAALPYAARVLVTRRAYASAAALGARYGFTTLYNDAASRGMGTSAALGARWCMEHGAEGALFGVCDQPYLKRESVSKLLDAFSLAPGRICAAASAARRGNPCVFPRDLLPALGALDGEAGGGSVIALHSDRLDLINCFDARELTDIDARTEEA